MFKKIMKLALIPTICLTFLFTGCGKSIEPTDAAVALFDLYQKGIISENVGGSKSDAEELIKDNKKLTFDYFKKEYENYEGSVTDKELNELVEKVYESSKPVTVKAEEVSKDGKTAVVKLTSKPIDNSQYDEFSQEQWSTVSEDKFEDASTNLNMSINYNNEVSKNPKYADKEESIEITLTKDGNYWIIESQKDLKKFDKLTYVN